MPVTHAFHSNITSGADTSLVRPTDWNANHVGNSLGWFNVKDPPYNAVGDGVNDDTAEIQAAVTAAAAAGGGIVYLPAGVYLTTGLTWSGSQICFKGAGRRHLTSGGTVVKLASGTGACFSNSDYTVTRWSSGLEDLTVDISAAGDGARCVELYNMRRTVFHRLALTDGSYDVLTAWERTPHSHGIGIKIRGSSAPGYYEASHNAYYDIDIVAGDTCVLFDPAGVTNGNRFFNGSWEGPGKAIVCNPTTYNSDTNFFCGMSIATSNATAVELGNSGGGALKFVFLGVRWESRYAGRSTFLLGNNAKWTEVIGGQMERINIVDNLSANANQFVGVTWPQPYDYNAGSGGCWDLVGYGSPEGVFVGGVGSTYRRTDGSSGNTFYIKETGSGSTGWRKVTTSLP